MSMAEAHHDDLEPWFAAARAQAPRPEAGMMARLMADAEAVAAARTAPVATAPGGAAPLPPLLPSAPARSPVRPSVRRHGRPRLVSGLGGWKAVAGLLAAGVAGVWIGLAVPEMVGRLSPLTSSTDTLDLLAAADSYFEEG